MDFNKILTDEDIRFILLLINCITYYSIENYWFEEEKINEILYENDINTQIIDKLVFENILQKDIIKKCNNCNEQISLCECFEKDIIEKRFYKIVPITLIEYFKNTFSIYYNVNLKKINSNNEYEELYSIDRYDIKIQINYRELQEEYLDNVKLNDRIVISIMPLKESLIDNSNIYEWHEVLNENNINNLKIKISDLNSGIKSNDFYYLNLGDDLKVEEIESIREVLGEYLQIKGFSIYTENKKYKPEYINYSIPLEKIKECYIKDNYKVFILKPSLNEINIAYFKNGILGEDSDIYDIIDKFNKFIREKVKYYRKIKSLEVKSDTTQKIVQLTGPVINIGVFISSLFIKNNLLTYIINVLIESKVWFLYLYIGLNIVSLVFIIIYTIFPYMLKIFFSWKRGIRKLK